MTEVLRWVRALTVACLLLVTGVGGHVAADGAAPAAPWLAVLLVLTTVAVAPALGAPASSARVVLLLVAGQLLLHLTLVLAASEENAGTAGSAMAHASMAGSPMGHGHAASAEAMPALMSGAHLGMVLAHLTAALVVALWLAAGERAVWTLLAVAARPVADALSRTLRAACADALLVVGTVRDRRPRPGHGSGVPVRSDVWFACGVSRRGPPSPVVA